MICLVIVVVLISIVQILWTPYIIERYRMDLYFLFGIACFIVVGFMYKIGTPKQNNIYSFLIVVFAVLTLISSVLLCIRQVEVYYPEYVFAIKQFLFVWLN